MSRNRSLKKKLNTGTKLAYRRPKARKTQSNPTSGLWWWLELGTWRMDQLSTRWQNAWQRWWR